MTTSAYRENIKGIVWNHQKPKARPRGERRSAPYVIGDNMDAVWHPCTGKVMDSKSAFRRVTREHGCYEVGNDVQSAPKPVRSKGAGQDVRRAIEELRSR